MTACKDAAGTIEATLESVVAQRCQDLEHLVVDGASQDGTCELVRSRAGERVRLSSQPDGGIYEAFNRGLSLAQGELIAFLGSGDRYADPGVLARVAELAARHPEVDLFHGDLDLVEGQRVVGRWRFQPAAGYERLAVRCIVAHPTVFARRGLFARVGPFDPGYRIAGDYEHLLRCWRAGARFLHVPEVLVLMDAGGLSQRQQRLCGREVFRAARTHTGAWVGPTRQLLHHELTTRLRRVTPGLLGRAQRLKRWLRGAPPDMVTWGP